jgi:acetyl-CoA carboxylase biotin carboxylase subunit
VRIIRAAKALGLRTVRVHSQADADSLAVKLADEAIDIGPPAAKSYLNIEAPPNGKAAKSTPCIQATALSENADFAEAVVAAGMKFVGPDAAAVGCNDKVAAPEWQPRLVPVVPGAKSPIAKAEDALALAKTVGFPVMIKAAAGGGGRGIRIARTLEEFERHFPQASAEAAAAFGDGGLYIEKVIEKARHIEVQILGDGNNFVHCYERECSLQQRRQKVWEELRQIGLPADVLKRLCGSAVALARSVGYSGAGTVEYLYDDASRDFYFIEVNTRIRSASGDGDGHRARSRQNAAHRRRGRLCRSGRRHFRYRPRDQCRISSDPHRNFMPGQAPISSAVPEGGHRFDTMLFAGYTVPPFYDSLLGKLIVHGADRTDCLAKLRAAWPTLASRD